MSSQYSREDMKIVDCFFTSSSVATMASALLQETSRYARNIHARVYDGAHLAGHEFLPYRARRIPNNRVFVFVRLAMRLGVNAKGLNQN
jgi:hypothetical protein